MFHSKRRWVVAPVNSAEELARMLTEQTWCLCNGFELQGYWFLNDATHEDGASEYGVIQVDGPAGKPLQVESITMSWCTLAEAVDYIRRAIAGEYDDADYVFAVNPRIETPDEHGRCPLCA